MNSQKQPSVTIAVIPRESFGFSCKSLDDLYDNTDFPFELVYVDGKSPRSVRRGIAQRARRHGFEHIRLPHYVSPNVARNIAIGRARGDYIVFVDNDIFFERGWLGRLVDCAEETGAAVVGPLTCIDEPLHSTVHNGGGMTWFEDTGVRDLRRAHQTSYFADTAIADVASERVRFPCDYVEFHTMLVRRSLFDEIGPLDEKLLSTREHIDFCLLVREAGHTTVCERASVITYLGGVTPSLSDFAYYLLRWSDAWDLASLDHFRQKWRLLEDDYFHKRYRRLGERRAERVFKPLLEKIPFLPKRLAGRLRAFEHWCNARLSDRFARRHAFARHSAGLTRTDRLSSLPTEEKEAASQRLSAGH